MLADGVALPRDGLAGLLDQSGFDVRMLVADHLGGIGAGGAIVDPGLIQELVASRRADDPLGALPHASSEVLALMVEGRPTPSSRW